MKYIIKLLRKFYYFVELKLDTIRGVDFFETKGFNESDYDKSMSVQYEPSRAGFQQVLRKLNITNNDSIIDIGCGKGKAISLLSKFPFKSIDGFDISIELCKIAQNNLMQLGIKNSEIFCENALVFDSYDKYNFFYLYNPVPPKVFEVVFEKINESLTRLPRKIHIININPQYSSIILANPSFRLVYSKQSQLYRYLIHYYSNII